MKRFIVACALVIGACNRQEQPQAPTSAESEQLNEAEEMLNGLANEGGPAENRS